MIIYVLSPNAAYDSSVLYWFSMPDEFPEVCVITLYYTRGGVSWIVEGDT